MQTHHLFSYAVKLHIILSFCCITEKLIVTLQFQIAPFPCKLFFWFSEVILIILSLLVTNKCIFNLHV